MAFAITLAAPHRGFATVVATDYKQSVLVTPAAAIGCTIDGNNCPEYVGVNFGDRPGLTYPAKFRYVIKEGSQASIAVLFVDRGQLPEFTLAKSAKQGDAVTVPVWCNLPASAYLSSVSESGAWLRTNVSSSKDKGGCPIVSAAGELVGVLGGSGESLELNPGFTTIASGLQRQANVTHIVGGWEEASLDFALDRARGFEKKDPHGTKIDFYSYDGDAQRQATPLWCRGADLGSAEAAVMCARNLALGIGAQRDLARAVKILQKNRADPAAAKMLADLNDQYLRYVAPFPTQLDAAKTSDPAAIYAVGEAYWTGTAVTEDRTAAVQWFSRCTSENCRRELALAYQFGQGVIPDLALAKQYGAKIQEAATPAPIAALGSIRDKVLSLAKAAEAGHRYWGDKEWYAYAPQFKQLAATGDAFALYVAGAFFGYAAADRTGRSDDDETSFAYFKKASDLGNYRASFYAADAYGQGKVVPVDLNAAQKLRNLSVTQALNAAAKGDVDAYSYLGWAYRGAFTGAPNCHEAIKWLTRAVDAPNGDYFATSDLLGPLGSPWFNNAADYELGLLYTEDPRFSEIYPDNPCFDMALGERWLRHASARGISLAADRLTTLQKSGRLAH